MQGFEEVLEGHALLMFGPRGLEKCRLIEVMHRQKSMTN